MSATYCFTERPLELFAEGVTRGWLAAILDFPRGKSHQEAEASAQSIPDELRPDVCCIGEHDYPYRLLVVAAWVNGFRAFVRDVSEREKVMCVSVLKAMPTTEALAFLRPGFSDESAIEEAYARFQALQQTALTGLTRS